MEFLPKEPYKRISYILLYTVLGIIGFFLFFKFVFPVLLPFIIAFIIACAVRKPALFLAKKTEKSVKFFSVLFGILALTVTAVLISVCVTKLIGELSSFVSGIMENKEEILNKIMGFSEKTDSFLSRFITGNDDAAINFRKSVSDFITDASKNILSGITTKIPAVIGGIFSKVPLILFSVIAMVLSCIYFCLDFDDISNFFSKKAFSFLNNVKKAYFTAVGKYMRACLVIFLMTAAELTIGFLIIGVKYSLLMGVITAFIDILPVFGSGTVLIPFAVMEFIKGNFSLGIGLVALYTIVTFIRQISEPKIMGKNLGVHPLLSLICVYAGYRFFGVVGMIFLPITAVILKNIFLTKEDAAKI